MCQLSGASDKAQGARIFGEHAACQANFCWAACQANFWWAFNKEVVWLVCSGFNEASGACVFDARAVYPLGLQCVEVSQAPFNSLDLCLIVVFVFLSFYFVQQSSYWVRPSSLILGKSCSVSKFCGCPAYYQHPITCDWNIKDSATILGQLWKLSISECLFYCLLICDKHEYEHYVMLSGPCRFLARNLVFFASLARVKFLRKQGL